jgi:hypothetical protein
MTDVLTIFLSIPLLKWQERTDHHVYTRDVGAEDCIRIFDSLHDGWTNCLDDDVVDQYVEALASEMLLHVRHSIPDTGLTGGVRLDEDNTIAVLADQVL